MFIVRLLAPLAAAAVLFLGCESEQQETDYVARVGDQYLTRDEVDETLKSLPMRMDSVETRRQIVDQWVTNALLFREATRRGLRSTEEVRRQLEESERSILASALLQRLYAEDGAEPTPSEILGYFERNKELFRIREPYVRVRHLSHTSRDTALVARQAMLELARISNPDSAWQSIASSFSGDASSSLELSATHLPQSHLFSNQSDLHEALLRLRPGETSSVIEFDGGFHVIQLADRVAPGSLPEIEWVEDELRRRLVIQERKQIYATHVQRLRNEALAREVLEIP